ncbi:MAG: pyridoxamine 5'-phosphate oxidase family protein [Sphingobacteriales bacterium]|nr:pyridoxamine 5'-phosphate oxidase family protein [Sphingobacteriales bacterium]
MKDKIDKYIGKQTCAAVCCLDEFGNPYCFNCFYSYDIARTVLVYKSSPDTQHQLWLSKNPSVAGTILPDRLNLLQMKGVQFTGIVLPVNHPLAENASADYYKKHPVALAIKGEIWVIQINSIKFTDNSLGFGKKLTWNRTAALQ